MNILERTVDRLNTFQQRHSVLAFPYAVIKKFGDDNGGYQAALMTYYGFLSLFPLLLVLVTIMHLWFNNNPGLQAEVSDSLSRYFPLLGDQLQDNVGNMSKTGFGLIAGILFSIYGARGAADALRFSLDTMWHIPKNKRAGFPKNTLKSLAIIGILALGFAATIATSVITSAFGQAVWIKVGLNLVSILIIGTVLTTAFRIGMSQAIRFKHLALGGFLAGAGIQALLTFGSLLVAAQLKNLDSLYGTFAIVLGLLFWIYLLAQVVVYSAEVATVHDLKLWPRSLDAKQPTAADKQAYKLDAQAERYIEQERIGVSYK